MGYLFTGEPSLRIRWSIIVTCLFLGGFLRLYNLWVVDLQMPNLVADALEYKRYGQYIVGTESATPIADRPPAFPIVLGLFYSILGVDNDLAFSQRFLTLSFDLGVCFLLYVVLRILCNTQCALLSMILYAFNGEIIRNSLSACTEQWYMLVSMGLMYLSLRLRPLETSVWGYMGIGLTGIILVMTKQEGFLVLAFYLAFVSVRILRLDKLNVVHWISVSSIALFALVSFGGYKYYSSHVLQIPTMNYRTGNALFHAEFLADRLPWGYMRDLRNEYFRMSNIDWLFEYHSISEIFFIVIYSTILVFRYLAEMLGGWILLPCLLVSTYWVRNEKVAVLFLLLFLSLLPFFFLAEPHSRSSYTPRLLLPAMPYAIALLANSFTESIQRFARSTRNKYVTPLAFLFIAVYVMLNLGTSHALGTYPGVRKIVLNESEEVPVRPPFDVDKVIDVGMELQILGEYEESRRNFQAVLDYLPNYAPAHLGMAYVSLAEGKVEEGRAFVEKAIEASSYFAEAHAARIVLQLKENDFSAALASARQCAEWRPDYAPCQLVLGHLLVDSEGDFAGASAAYENYAQLNYAALNNYLDYLRKQVSAFPNDGKLRDYVERLESALYEPISSLMTLEVWGYVHYGKGGAFAQRIKPEDRTYFYCAGLVYEKLGKGIEAERMYERGLKLNPQARPIRERLQKMRADGVGVGLVDPLRLGASLHRFDILYEQLVEGYHSPQYFRVRELQ